MLLFSQYYSKRYSDEKLAISPFDCRHLSNVVHASADAKRSLTMTDLTISVESPDQPSVIALLTASDQYHAALYPAESNHLVDVASLKTANVRFLVARLANGTVAGCGAFVLSMDDSFKTAELKRMWVAPTARGNGLGRRLLAALETQALSEGARVIRLETGIYQLEALGLYRASGYVGRAPFGSYQRDPLSIFMEKVVDNQE